MEKPKLQIDELEVTSFATSALAPSLPGDTVIVTPGDPTAATWCFICPVRTQDCF
jgi:hypothetical protein